VSLPAIMKHLDVLSDAGLVARTKTGPHRRLPARRRADAGRVRMAQSLRKFWSERLSIAWPLFWRKKSHVHPNSHQTEPHHQAPLQGAAGQSLRGVDRPGKSESAGWARARSRRRSAESDLRVGGRYRWVMQAPTARSTMSAASIARWSRTRSWFSPGRGSGTPERESLVTVLLKPDGDGTLLTLTHEQFFDEDARDRHQGGWNGALDKMENFSADVAGSESANKLSESPDMQLVQSSTQGAVTCADHTANFTGTS
jgi:hypothetical protein